MRNILLILLGLILLSPVSGELWRLPIFSFELLPSDIFIPLFFVVWGADKWKHDPELRVGKIGKAILLFLAFVILSYLLNFYRFPLKEMIVAGSYLVRFATYILLTFMVFDLLERDKTRRTLNVILGGMMGSMALIVTLGFLQLKFFPSFLELGLDVQGWDPHIGRLLSTWFDPNFIGGYLAFMLGITVALGLYFRHHQKKAWFWALAALSMLGLVALYTTFSRSGYLAMAVTLMVLAFLKSPKLLVAFLVLFLLGFAFSPRFHERVIDAFDSAKAFIGLDSPRAIDPSARLRLDSWNYALEIIRDHPLIGVGYSRYAYEIVERGHGLPSDHNVGGSDSSLLTLWATTGIGGLLSYLAIGFVAAIQGFRRVWKKRDFLSYLAAGLLAGFGGVMVHSIFVNSLFYALMMGTLWVSLGILDSMEGSR